MRTVNYLRVCAFLPIIISILLAPFARLNLDPLGIAKFFLATMYVAGLPYAVFALASVLLLWRSPASAYWDYGYYAPFIFTGFFWIAMTAYVFIEEGQLEMSILWIVYLGFGFAIVLVGYCYLGLAWWGYIELSRKKLLNDL